MRDVYRHEGLSLIHEGARISPSAVIGRHCIIEDDCIIGHGTVLGDYCKLLPGSVIGRGCRLDDYANTSGAVVLGDNVMVKRMTCITQGTIIEDRAFVGPGVMIIHEKDVSWCRDTPKVSEGVYIRAGAIIGGCACLNAGVTIGLNAVVGAGAVVTRDCAADTVYVGAPARRVAERSPDRRINVSRVRALAFDDSILARYLPELRRCGWLTFRQ